MELSKHEATWLKSEGAKMLTSLGVKQGHHALDFGCGEGRYTVPLSQVVGKEGCVYSVERNEEAILAAKERLSLFSDPDVVRLLKSDDIEAAGLIPKKSIDAIFAFDVLQYIPDSDKLFLYFRSLLKPNGMVCIYPAAIPHPGDVDIKLIITKMKKIGLQYVKSTEYKMMHSADMVDDIVHSFKRIAG